MATDETKARAASENARDKLNRLVKHPVVAQEPDDQDSKGPGLRSQFRDPSTKDGQLRWD